MSHISYWLNAISADFSNSCICFEQLPIFHSIRFCSSLPTDPEILYLGNASDLEDLLSAAAAPLSGITMFSAGISRSLTEKARTLNCNCICSGYDIFTLYNILEELCRTYRDWQRRFDLVCTSGHSIQDIVDTAADITGFSIFLLNIANRVIYRHIDPKLTDSIILQMTESGYLDESGRQFLLDDIESPRAIRKELPSGQICWIYKVIKQNTVISNMIFAAPSEERQFDTYTIMEMTRQAIHHLMRESNGPSYWAGENFRRILQQVISSKDLELYEINRQFSQISCSSGIFCSIIIIEFEHPEILIHQSTPILTELEALFPDNNAAVYDNSIVMLLARPDRAFQPRPSFDTDAMTALLNHYEAYASISNASSRRSLFRTQYLLTRDILNLGRHLFPEKSSRIYYFEELAEYITIEQSVSCFHELYGHDDIMLMIHPDAAKLIRYDMQHHTALLEFVYYYCLCNCNIAQTAKAAYMHRNTASSRLAKIQQLIQADLENGEVQQRMIYSYKVYLYYSRCSDTDLEKRITLGYTLRN